MTGTDILAVPYKGVAEATNDVIAGRIDMFLSGRKLLCNMSRVASCAS